MSTQSRQCQHVFKEELEKRLGFKLSSAKKIEKYGYHDHIGWHKQKDGKWYLGLFIENGRIYDGEDRKIKSGLRMSNYNNASKHNATQDNAPVPNPQLARGDGC